MWMARCVIAVVDVAPCQCFSPGESQTTSRGFQSRLFSSAIVSWKTFWTSCLNASRDALGANRYSTDWAPQINRHRGRDRQRPCPRRAREFLSAFALRYRHRDTLVCAPDHTLHCRGGTAPGDAASPCSRSPQAALSRYEMPHGTASIQGRLSRTKLVYMPRGLTRRIHCSSAIHRSLAWNHQRLR
jgi:hypothetical protein